MNETVIVGRYAFYSASVYNIDLRSVEYIEENAFQFSSLIQVNIPDTCISLGDWAFDTCASLSTLHIGRGLDKIPSNAFGSDSMISELFVPNNIKFIGSMAFNNTGISTLTFEENSQLYYIGPMAFETIRITALQIPSSVVCIDDGAFKDCASLGSVSFGENSTLQEIGSSAFCGNISLSSIQLPETVRKIGAFCFSKSGLTGEVHIPASLRSYGEGMFSMCERLTDIRIAQGNETFKDSDGIVYSFDYKTLIEYPAGKTAREFTPLNTTETIRGYAFYGNKRLETFIMPDSVTTVGDSAFGECVYMRNYTLSENLVFAGQYAFSENLSLRRITIPDSLKQISRFSFSGDLNLETVEISDNSAMRRIGMHAFANCGITEFRIPKKISSVAQYAFEDCKRLRRVVFAENSELQSISAYFFMGCDSIEEIVFESGSALTSVQAHGLHGLTNLRRIDFGDAQINEIDNYAFRQCPALTEITLPNTVTNIGRFAFYRCSGLTSLNIPDSIVHIGEYAFLGTTHFNLYFQSESLPIYLDENWDAGIDGYNTGVLETVTDGDWEYAVLRNNTVSILKYNGTDKNIDLSSFAHGDISIIGGYSFAYTDVESVILPDTLEQIQRYAFAECASLQSITIPANVTFIAQYAFYKTGIDTLTFSGNSLKVIEQYAFSATKRLTTAALPGSLEKLGNGVFYQSGISSVSFEPGFSISAIPDNMFAETKLSSVIIPDCVTDIGSNAFSHNTDLESVDLGNGEDLIIRSYAFYNTGLTSVNIGRNVSYIGEYTFTDLDSLSAFAVDPENTEYTAENGVLYNKNKTKIISVPAGKTGSFVIPKEIEVLGFGAFENSKLTDITIEEGSSLVTLGYRVFYGAKGLTSFTVPKSVISIDYYAFAECENLRTVTFEQGNRLSGIYEGAFFGCCNLENITLPDTVVEISDYAFYACESLETLPVSDNSEILGIYDYAFAYTKITELDIPGQLYDIGKFAFRGIGIKELVIAPDDYRIFKIGIGAFADCYHLESVTLPFVGEAYDAETNYWFGFIFGSDYPEFDPEFVPESLKNITITVQKDYNKKDSHDNILYSFYRLANVETVVLPEDTYYIGPNTFLGFSSLKEFDIPRLLNAIEDFTFNGCSSLKSVYLPDGIKYIGRDAFTWCHSLESVRINDGLERIGATEGLSYGVFRQSAIKEIYLPDTLNYMDECAFMECENLRSVTIPSGVVFRKSAELFKGCTSLVTAVINCNEVGDEMFMDCSSLETVELIGDVRSIGNTAFGGCEKLTNITVPEHLEYIGIGAFSNCKSLKCDLILPEGLTTIGNNAFDGAGITSLVLPYSVESVGAATFRFCSNLTNVEIKSKFKSFPSDCFYGDYNIEEIKLPDTLEIIESGAFFDFTKLNIRELPASLKAIGTDAFAGCESITEIVLPEGLVDIGDNAFGRTYYGHTCSIYSIINNSNLDIGFSSSNFGSIAASAILITDKNGEHYPDNGNVYLKTPEGLIYQQYDNMYELFAFIGETEEATVPTSINGKPVRFALTRTEGNKKVIVSEGFEEIATDAYIDELVLPSTLRDFYLDRSAEINKITVASGNQRYRMENGLLCVGNEVLYCPFGMQGSVTVPDGITRIAPNAFNNRKITAVTFPNTLEEICDSAFFGCKNLKKIVLPDSLTTLEHLAFCNCSSLKEVDYGSLETIGDSAFYSCGFEKIIIPGTVKTVGPSAFGGINADEIIVQEGVEELCDYAFEGCHNVTSVTLPSSLKTIGGRVFSGCESLLTLNIPVNVEEIGGNAFPEVEELTVDENSTHFTVYDKVLYDAGMTTVLWASKSLKYVELPPTLTVISDSLFFDNDSIVSVVIPEGVTSIGKDAFACCDNLSYVELPESLRFIGQSAFEYTNVKEIHLSAVLEEIGKNAFPENMETITLSDGNEHFSLQDGVLYVWKGEKSCTYYSTMNVADTVVIPEGITLIGDWTFRDRPIKKVVFPSTLREIGMGAFIGSQLEEIDWADSQVVILNDYSFENTNITELILPETVDRMVINNGPTSFSGCRYLRKVYIPAAVQRIADAEFDGCEQLEEITISQDNANYYAVDNIIYKKGTYQIFKTPYVYNGTLTLPEGITAIPDGAFNNRRALTSIVLPESLNYIGSNAFEGSGLQTVIIPSAVTSIADGAFNNCTDLKYVENESDIVITPHGAMFPDSLIVKNKGSVYELSINDWRYYISGDYIMSEYTGTEEIENKYRLNIYLGDLEVLTLPTEIDGHSVVPYMFEPRKASTLIIQDGVEVIPDYAFYCSRTLRKLVLPETVRSFGTGIFCNVFYGSSLTEINLPQNMIDFPWSVFEECHDLASVTLPNVITEIPSKMFYRCYSLHTIELPESVRSIAAQAFVSSGIRNIDFPPYLESIGSSAFDGCSGMNSVIIPDSVRTIGSRAFYTESLNNITLPDTDLFLGADFITCYPEQTRGYAANENNWDGDFLYCGNHLIRYRGNDKSVVVSRDVKSICENAFKNCSRVKYLEISGSGIGSIHPRYLTNLEMLIIRHEPGHRIFDYFRGDWDRIEPPDTLKYVVLKNNCFVEHRDEFDNISNISIFVEGTKAEMPFDRIAPGWNNNNAVTYGDKWYMAKFFDAEGKIISIECFRNTQPVRLPYVVLPKSGDKQYTHIGWDLDGDGTPDGIPASRLSDIEARAVVMTTQPAYYTVKFMDFGRKTVIDEFVLEYGQIITPPAVLPERKGYTFIGWENYNEGDTVSEDIKIYSKWRHNGDGHDYITTLIPPTCTERGYTLHKCSICDDEYKTDFINALWHSFDGWITDTEATCSENGSKHRVCSICGFVENAVIDTTGHQYVSNVIQEATCTNPGVMSYTCSVCNNHIQEAIPLQPHDFRKVLADKAYIEWLDKEFSGIVWGNEGETYWYYICSDCGKIQTVSVAKASSVGSHRHQYSVISNSSQKPVAVRCTLCGEVICHEHDFEEKSVENGLALYECKNCHTTKEEYVDSILRFYSVSLTLQNNLKINFNVRKDLIVNNGYTDVYTVFMLNGKTATVREYTEKTVDGVEYYVFSFSNIAPNLMKDTLTATMHATLNGVEYVSDELEYKVATYCYSMLEKLTDEKIDNMDSAAKKEKARRLRTLLVDLLNYAASSQIYTNYNINDLADKELSSAQKAWGTVSDPELHSVVNTTVNIENRFSVLDAPEITWKSAALSLNDSVTIKFSFTAANTDGISVVIESENGEILRNISADELEISGGRCIAKFKGLNVGQMSEKIYITVYRENTAISNTLSYSIESYAYTMTSNDVTDTLSNLLKAMMKYGNAAYNYAH